MNSQDVTRALKSGSFVFWMIALALASLVLGFTVGTVDAATHVSSPGTMAVAVVAWIATFFFLGFVRSLSIASFIDDKFSGLLEAPLVRPVSRAGLVFGRLLGVIISVFVGAILFAVLLPIAYNHSSSSVTFPLAVATNLALGLMIVGVVAAALDYLIAYAVSSGSAARWTTRALTWLGFVVFSFLASVGNLPTLLVANPLMLPLTLATGAVPYSVPSGFFFRVLFVPLQATRLGEWALLGIGALWLAVTLGGLFWKVQVTD